MQVKIEGYDHKWLTMHQAPKSKKVRLVIESDNKNALPIPVYVDVTVDELKQGMLALRKGV